MDIKKVKKILRSVAINVSKFTEDIADKLDDKDTKEDIKTQTEVKSPEIKENPEIKGEENVVSNQSGTKASDTRDALNESIEKRDEENVIPNQSGTKEADTRDALNENIEKRNEDKDVNIDDKSTFLIDGEDYVEKAEEKKHDIKYMKKCCLLELEKMKVKNEVPSPFYFERVAILSKKDKNYEQEVKYCEDYIKAVDEFYTNNKDSNVTDVRKTTKYHSLVKRIDKAKSLISKD